MVKRVNQSASGEVRHREGRFLTGPRHLRARYVRALRFFLRASLGFLFWDLGLAHLGMRSLSRRTAPSRYRRLARSYRTLAAELGGVWIKVGQFLSARVDMLPASITEELAGLQDEIAAESLAAMQSVLNDEFSTPVDELFAWFEPQPLASASLGQVHRARLASGEHVVVKIQRPGIHDIIRVDLAALAAVIGWLKRYRPITRRANLDALLSEFSRTLWQELDYLAEAEHARRFAEMFAEDPKLRVPRVYPTHTTAHVLTLEDVYFIKVTNYQAIEQAGIDRVEVAERLFNTYLHQIFVQGFFHADPHPGNLFVEPLPDKRWRLVFVDFGMVGRLTAEVKAGIRNLAIALGTRDLDRLMTSYQQLGVLLPGADLQRIRAAEEAMFQSMWGKSMREIAATHPQEMRKFALQFRDLLYEMPFQLPSDLVFLGRCVAILSGICIGLDPEFNLFQGLAPFAQQLLTEEGGDWLDTLLDWLIKQGSALVSLPSRLDTALTRLERGELTLTTRAAPDLQHRLRLLTRAVNRLVGAVIFAALLVVGTWLYLSGEHWIGGGCLVVALLVLGWILFG